MATVQPTILDPKKLWGPTLLTTASVTQYTAPALEAGVQIGGILLTNIGLVDFAKVWHLDATVYVDETTDASDVGATDVSIFQTDSDSDGGGAGAADRFYVGSATKFSHIAFILGQVGTGSPVLLAAYWNGSAWTDLTLATNNYVDGTNNLKQSGELSFTAPCIVKVFEVSATIPSLILGYLVSFNPLAIVAFHIRPLLSYEHYINLLIHQGYQ